MKRIISITVAVVMCVFGSITAYAQPAAFSISNSSREDVYADNPYGIDLTGEACAVNNGLAANLVNNGSFEKKDEGWSFEGVDCVLGSSDSISAGNPTYNIVRSSGTCIIRNHGYGEKGAMGFVKGERYVFTCNIKNIDFEGEVFIQLDSAKNKGNLVKLETDSISKKGWSAIKTGISSTATEKGSLAIIFKGNGSLQLDCISLVSDKSYGYGTAEWKNAYVRNDCFAALKMLSPSFVAFNVNANEWKYTIGSISDRSGRDEIGYHEYLQLCSDMNAAPVPTIDTDSIENPDNYTQGVLDLIEYANADSTSSYFGALRAGNGREEPFDIKYIYLKGNGSAKDNIKASVQKRYENICILTDEYFYSVCNITEYASGDNKCNMGSTVLDANEMISSDYGFIALKNAIGYADSEKDLPCLIIADSNSIALTPEYYSQLILANNFGDNGIRIAQADERVNCTARVDSAKKILYIYCVNSGSSSANVSLAPDGFDNITEVSMQSVSSGYKTASNSITKQRIAPEAKELEMNNASLDVKLEANSVNVIRIAYDSNTGQNIYQLPEELDLDTGLYVPATVVAVIIALCVSIPLGSVAGFFMYKKLFSKKKEEKGFE